MSAPSTDRRENIISLRVPADLAAAVRAIARRDVETSATIWRRLLRKGLDVERRADGGRS